MAQVAKSLGSILPFDHHQYPKLTCISKVKYGLTIFKYCRNARPHFARFFLHERSPDLLQWISVTKDFIKSIINIKDITRIDVGQEGIKFRGNLRPEWADLSVSIYYGASSSLDLVFACVADLQEWLSGLAYLYEDIQEKEKDGNFREHTRITHEWIFADRDGNNELDYQEIKALMQRCNININERALRLAFQQVDANHNGVLDFEEFLVLNEKMNYKKELAEIFQFYSERCPIVEVPQQLSRVIGVNMFKRFLDEEQGQGTLLDEDIIQIFRSYQTPAELGYLASRNYMSESGFRKYVFSLVDNLALRNLAIDDREMQHPFHHYFIFSTHNTYLTGHQLRSESRAEQFAVALGAGARFVELDCWNGPGGEPVVTHGNTLCTKIFFRDAITCISQSAFQSSPYPVIITFEIHCSIEQQERMADIMEEKLRDAIYIPPSEQRELPSPYFLRKRFLLRGKRPAPGSTDVETEAPAAGGHGNLLVLELHRVEISPRLNAMYAISNTKFDISSNDPMSMSTVSENKFLKLVKTHGSAAMAEYLKRNMVRVTPANLRINSSNLIPSAFWAVGVQAAAQNFQTADAGMSITIGMFNSRGGAAGGYLLKPGYLYDPRIPFSTHDPGLSNPTLKLTVKVKSGQYFPKPRGSQRGEIIDPYVTVQIHGSPADTFKERQTAEVTDNGYNPVWDETFEFELRAAELAVLRLCVNDNDPVGADFICQNSLPVTEIRQGLRVVPMYDFNNRLLENTSLLCEFKLTPLRTT